MRSRYNETKNRLKLLEYLLTWVWRTQSSKQVLMWSHNQYPGIASRWAHLWGESVYFLLIGRKKLSLACARYLWSYILCFWNKRDYNILNRLRRASLILQWYHIVNHILRKMLLTSLFSYQLQGSYWIHGAGEHSPLTVATGHWAGQWCSGERPQFMDWQSRYKREVNQLQTGMAQILPSKVCPSKVGAFESSVCRRTSVWISVFWLRLLPQIIVNYFSSFLVFYKPSHHSRQSYFPVL